MSWVLSYDDKTSSGSCKGSAGWVDVEVWRGLVPVLPMCAGYVYMNGPQTVCMHACMYLYP